jgi:hypothetical protein
MHAAIGAAARNGDLLAMDAAIPHPTFIRPSKLLRFALFADVAGSGAMGLLCLLGAGVLAGPLGLPSGFLQGIGLFIVIYSPGIAWLASRPALPGWVYATIVGLNAVWVLDSLLLLVSGWVAPTGLGIAFILAQAAAVAGFAVAQWIGLRQSRA